MPKFRCQVCDQPFDLPQKTLDKYPGWTPRYCREHSPKKKGRGRSAPAEERLTLAQVRSRFSGGPQDGVFTDGGCTPNPGPGGWGVVWVRGGEIVEQRHGHARDTTNNRMELTALIEALRLLPADEVCDVFSDSQLCVKTVNEWAPSWEKRGWRRKGGPIKNLELVQELYALHGQHPRATLRWIAAHNGNLWNEYADALAGAWQRDEL